MKSRTEAPRAGASVCPECGRQWRKVGPEGYTCDRCGFFPREHDTPAPPSPTSGSSSSSSQATRLVQLAALTAELFHTPDGETFAAIEMLGHRETRAIRSQGFRGWMAQRFYAEEGKAAAGAAIADALTALEGKALYEGEVRYVWTRVAEDANGNILIDLGSDRWDALLVSPTGWKIVSVPTVHFRRANTTAALCLPERGGSLEDMRQVINLPDDKQFQRIVGWSVGALRPQPPYPALVFVSEHGSGKSVAAKCIRSLVDPSSLPLRAPPKEERDLAIAARGNHVLAFDNVSHLPGWLSNALCRIATGEGWATRKLYTDAEEEIFTFARPVLLTGIDDFVVASDLLDRSLFAALPAIRPEQRRQEIEVLAQFEAMRPRLLGALLDALVMALQNRGTIWTGLPRMADFVAFVMNAEPALPWPKGAFFESFTDNEATAHEVVLEASPVAEELRGFVDAHPDGWLGTSTELLAALEGRVSDSTRRNRRWPKSARALSNEIRRILPTLRAIGVSVTFEREPRSARRRLIRLAATVDARPQPVDAAAVVDDGGVDDVDANQPVVDAGEAAADADPESVVDEVDGVDDGFPSLDEEREWEEEIE